MIRRYKRYRIIGAERDQRGREVRTVKAEGICRENEDAMAVAFRRTGELASCERVHVEEEPAFKLFVETYRQRTDRIPVDLYQYQNMR